MSHHTATVLRMLLGTVRVPALAQTVSELREACGDRHEIWPREVALDEYVDTGLPAAHMGRELADDRLFFEAALASGDALAAATVTELAA